MHLRIIEIPRDNKEVLKTLHLAENQSTLAEIL